MAGLVEEVFAMLGEREVVSLGATINTESGSNFVLQPDVGEVWMIWSLHWSGNVRGQFGVDRLLSEGAISQGILTDNRMMSAGWTATWSNFNRLATKQKHYRMTASNDNTVFTGNISFDAEITRIVLDRLNFIQRGLLRLLNWVRE